MSSFTVTGVGSPRTFQTKYGEMTSYPVGVEGEGEVEVTRKPTSPPPRVGETLIGEIVDSPYGKKFKREQVASTDSAVVVRLDALERRIEILEALAADRDDTVPF